MRARLVDVSRHQGKVNVAEIKAAGFCGLVARCTIGWSYFDPFYEDTQRQAHDIGMIFGAYNVLWPENRNPQREAIWANQKMGDVDFFVEDIELTQGISASNIGNQARTKMLKLEELRGSKPWVYTGSWFWNGNGALGSATPFGWEQEYALWEAEYLRKAFGLYDPDDSPEFVKPQTLGKGWANWRMWQWTSKGKPIGVQSKSLDYNVYNGTEEELREFLGSPQQLTLEEKVDILWEAHPELHPEGN
jgi:GH25 family lysozyme M1 (1,4-beta-N-acetylmuramidase)